jgi:hypothetical protein
MFAVDKNIHGYVSEDEESNNIISANGSNPVIQVTSSVQQTIVQVF